MRTNRQIKEEVLARNLPEIEFPVCVKQGDSYFRYQADGRFEHISVILKGIDHIQTAYSFGKLTWLTDYKEEIKTIIRRHGEISQEDFLKAIERYFNIEYKNFFSEGEIQKPTLKPEYNYFPENEIWSNNENIKYDGLLEF